MQVIKFITDSYKEFIYSVELPQWSELIDGAKIIALSTVLLVILLYGLDSSFSVFLENLYALLKKIKE